VSLSRGGSAGQIEVYVVYWRELVIPAPHLQFLLARASSNGDMPSGNFFLISSCASGRIPRSRRRRRSEKEDETCNYECPREASLNSVWRQRQ